MTATDDTPAADKEAFEHWGYLFNWDKTGTDNLKKLLRVLHEHIATGHEAHDSKDLTPTQLAHFYREVGGNYDQLFLSTPMSTVAFIYKNLGCIHSLQPRMSSGENKSFSNPNIPALKVDGWIMWQTIQLLLGPDEHAQFLMQALKKWDLKDPDTGNPFHKILPRACFPHAPDPHMTAWYEGMSERLRREADEEQSMRITAIEDEPRRQIESGDRPNRKHEKDHGDSTTSEDEPTAHSKKSTALAYFKNPLFRNNEGRPGVVRRNSKQPTLVERGMSAATSVGHVVRNIGSPFLWDGPATKEKEPHHDRHTHREKEKEKEKDKDKEKESHKDKDKENSRSRKSLPHSHRVQQERDEDGSSLPIHPRQAALSSSRRGSANNSPASDRELESSSGPSPRHTPTEKHHGKHASVGTPVDHGVRPSKSHDPTPTSPKDYFPPYEIYSASRRNSASNDAYSPESNLSPGRGTVHTEPAKDAEGLPSGFMPTASPLFATHVARNDYRPSKLATANKHAYTPRSSGRERYDSPARSPMGRSTSLRRDDDRRDDGRRDSARYSHHPSAGGSDVPPPSSRPKVARFDNGPAVGGNGDRVGRQYPKEGSASR